jgi:hypothetical protein
MINFHCEIAVEDVALEQLRGSGVDSCIYVRFEVFTALIMKNAVFWDVALCRSCVNRLFIGAYRLHLHGRKIRERGTSVSRLKPPTPAGGSLADFSTLTREAIRSSETSVHTRSTRHHISEDGIIVFMTAINTLHEAKSFL